MAGFAHGDAETEFGVPADPDGSDDVELLDGTVMSLEDSRREEEEPMDMGEAAGRPNNMSISDRYQGIN